MIFQLQNLGSTATGYLNNQKLTKYQGKQKKSPRQNREFPEAQSYSERDSQFVGPNRILEINEDESLIFDLSHQIEF